MWLLLGGAVFELQPANVSPLEYASNAALNREVRVWMEEANAAGGPGFLSGAFHIALSAFVSMVLFCLIGMILVLVFAAQIMLLVSLALLPVLLLLGVLPFNKTQEALGRIATLIFACIGVKFIVGAYLSAVVVLLYVVLVAGKRHSGVRLRGGTSYPDGICCGNAAGRVAKSLPQEPGIRQKTQKREAHSEARAKREE